LNFDKNIMDMKIMKNMKNAIFWDVAPCGSCGLEEHNVSIIRVTGICELGTVLAASVVPSSPIVVTLMMEAPHSSEASVRAVASRHGIPEDGILHQTDVYITN
jgi:hypothetical protein